LGTYSACRLSLPHPWSSHARALVHALTARAARETIPWWQLPATASAADDALVAVWPDPTTPIRPDCRPTCSTTVLVGHAGDALWHPVLFRAGNSPLRAGTHTAAITHWQRLTADAARILGPQHPDTLTIQANPGPRLLAGRADR
jgi:hypothetical protein